MNDIYMALAGQASTVLATGTAPPPVIRRRSDYDNPDWFGGAIQWGKNVVGEFGKFLTDPVGETLEGAGKWWDDLVNREPDPPYDPSSPTGGPLFDWDPLQWVKNVLGGGKGPDPNGDQDTVVDENGNGYVCPFCGQFPCVCNPFEEEDEDKDKGDKTVPGGATTYNYDYRTEEGDTYVTEEGDVTHIYHPYYYDPDTAAGAKEASNDGLMGSIFPMMLMMMMIMPMMQGMGGLQEAIKPEPQQADVSGWFY